MSLYPEAPVKEPPLVYDDFNATEFELNSSDNQMKDICGCFTIS